MIFLITGGTGLIGREFIRYRQSAYAGQDFFYVLTRQKALVYGENHESSQIMYIADLKEIPIEVHVEVVINLSGEPVAAKRWSRKRKAALNDSRIGVTQRVIDWMKTCDRLPHVMLSGSAVGWYGDSGAEDLDESSRFDELKAPQDYAHQLCEHWEKTAMAAEALGVRVCILRTGLVLAKNAGFLAQMILPLKLGVSGPIGSGRQYMSWIHLDDMVLMMDRLIDNGQGIFNCTAPEPTTNSEFTKSCAKVLHRWPIFFVPSWVLKLILGELSGMLLTGQKVLPRRILNDHYQFKYPSLDQALESVLR